MRIIKIRCPIWNEADCPTNKENSSKIKFQVLFRTLNFYKLNFN